MTSMETVNLPFQDFFLPGPVLPPLLLLDLGWHVLTLLQSLHPLGIPKQLPPDDAGKQDPAVPPDLGGPAYLVLHPPSAEHRYWHGSDFWDSVNIENRDYQQINSSRVQLSCAKLC